MIGFRSFYIQCNSYFHFFYFPKISTFSLFLILLIILTIPTSALILTFPKCFQLHIFQNQSVFLILFKTSYIFCSLLHLNIICSFVCSNVLFQLYLSVLTDFLYYTIFYIFLNWNYLLFFSFRLGMYYVDGSGNRVQIRSWNIFEGTL